MSLGTTASAVGFRMFTAHTLSYINSVLGAAGFLLDSWTLRMGPIGCLEKSVSNYHYMLCSNPEERSSQLFRGGRLKYGIRPMLLGCVYTGLRVSVLLSVVKSTITVIALQCLFLCKKETHTQPGSLQSSQSENIFRTKKHAHSRA